MCLCFHRAKSVCWHGTKRHDDGTPRTNTSAGVISYCKGVQLWPDLWQCCLSFHFFQHWRRPTKCNGWNSLEDWRNAWTCKNRYISKKWWPDGWGKQTGSWRQRSTIWLGILHVSIFLRSVLLMVQFFHPLHVCILLGSVLLMVQFFHPLLVSTTAHFWLAKNVSWWHVKTSSVCTCQISVSDFAW